MAYHLQFIGASIGFYRTSLTLLVQDLLKTDKKEYFDNFFKKSLLTGFYQKSTIIDLPYFLSPAMWTRVKSYTFWRKSPKSQKKFVKNHDFLEKFDFCDFNFSALLEVYTCARPASFYSYRVQDVWFCCNFSENINQGCFLSGIHLISEIFLC